MKLINFNSIEGLILKKVFNKYPLLDNNLIYYIESFIYKNVEEYFANGNLRSKYRLKFDKIDGEYNDYHENGKLYKKIFYIKDKTDYLTYYDNGNLAEHSIYKEIDGKLYKHGIQSFYCTCGTNLYTMLFNKGECVSSEIYNSIGDCENHNNT